MAGIAHFADAHANADADADANDRSTVRPATARRRRDRLGIPQDSREPFDLLTKAGVLDENLADRLKRMVGFRNVAVRDCQSLDLEIVGAIVERHLDDLLAFAAQSVRRLA